jgi:hypothetical protein
MYYTPDCGGGVTLVEGDEEHTIPMSSVRRWRAARVDPTPEPAKVAQVRR